MEKSYIRERITELRLKKDISEYQLSLDLGKSKSYIQNITSGKALPSIDGLFDICDYFKLTLSEFFHWEDVTIEENRKLLEILHTLDRKSIHDTICVLEVLKKSLPKE